METVHANDVSIDFRCVGTGKDVVLIHGLAANKGFWHLKVLLPLARRFRVTIYDLRGHGYSSMPPTGYGPADMAEDLHRLLDHLGISRAHLIGHSYGGAVGLDYALQHPERVSSLTVADSRLRAFQPSNRAKDHPNWESQKGSLERLGFFIPEDEPEIGLWLLEKLASPEWRSKREKLSGRPLSIPFSPWGGGNRSAEKWLELLHGTSLKRDVTAFDGSTADRLGAIHCPAFIIYGENSHVMPSFRGLRECLPRCKSAVVPGAGHFFPATQPELFAHLVGDFLDGLERGERRRHERWALRLLLDCRVDAGECFPAATLDVSRRGFLIASDRHVMIGAEIRIRTRSDQGADRIALRGRVVRIASMGQGGEVLCGVELLGAGGPDWRPWEDFLSIHRPVPPGR